MTDHAIQWLAVLSFVGLIAVLFVAWIEADPRRTAAVERVGYFVFGDDLCTCRGQMVPHRPVPNVCPERSR